MPAPTTDLPTLPDNRHRAAAWLLILCCGLYSVHAFYAVLLQRHLFGDASWYLVQMLSTGKPTAFYHDFFREFYYSRLTAYWLTQLPAVLAIRLGVASTQVVSWIFGATYFGLKLLSLFICFRLLGKREKPWIVFPLLGLFAGTIITDVYIVTEANVAVAFLWPVAIVLFRSEPLTRTTQIFATIAVLIASLTYEPWAFFAPILLAGLVVRSFALPARSPFPTAAAIALIVCAAINWCASIFPRDPANKADFLTGAVHALVDTFSGIANWHVGALASAVAGAIALSLVALPSLGQSRATRALVAIIAVLLAVLLPLHFYLNGPAVNLWFAVGDRGFGGLAMQLVLLVGFIAAALFRPATSIDLRNIGVLILGLALGQVAWQLMATRAWGAAAEAVSGVVNSESGVIPCTSIDAGQSRAHFPYPARIMCSWWVSPFSLTQARGRQVQSIIVAKAGWEAFDPLAFSHLPGERNDTFNYTNYVKAVETRLLIEPGKQLSFGKDGNAAGMLGDGFSHAETGLTWTDGQTATLHVCLPEGRAGSGNYRLKFALIPLVNPKGPALVAKVRAGNGEAAPWDFPPSSEPWVERVLDVHAGDFGASSCGAIEVAFANLPPSPQEMGENNDGRHLGLAFMKAEVTALP